MIHTYHFFETLLFLILEMTFPFSSPVGSGRPGPPAGASGARAAAGPGGHCRAQNGGTIINNYLSLNNQLSNVK